MIFRQTEFELRCEWGERGAGELAPVSDAVIIIDLLSFSTCVEIATSRGAAVFPYQWKDESAREFAAAIGAELAGWERGEGGYCLSPASLVKIPQGAKLVLPSPNGAAISLATGTTPTLVGCLRDCRAVALAAMRYGRHIAVIPSGERWGDGSLRPSFEDLIGAGAIISHLKGSPSPEARAAVTAYADARPELKRLLKQCGSGKELIARGYSEDVELASELDISDCVPTLVNGAYVHQPV
jgi:2-phosphosulfolactate phosphatase